MSISLENLKLYSMLDTDLQGKLQIMNNFATKVYSRTNWPGWVDHGPKHIQKVLKNLHKLIPQDVMEKIFQEEAFVLLASTLLHDVGMFPIDLPGHVAYTDEYYKTLRNDHGTNGAETVRNQFVNIMDDNTILLDVIADIIKNHHGDYDPEPIQTDFGYPMQAIIVRLADELDFGPERANKSILVKSFFLCKKYSSRYHAAK